MQYLQTMSWANLTSLPILPLTMVKLWFYISALDYTCEKCVVISLIPRLSFPYMRPCMGTRLCCDMTSTYTYSTCTQMVLTFGKGVLVCAHLYSNITVQFGKLTALDISWSMLLQHWLQSSQMALCIAVSPQWIPPVACDCMCTMRCLCGIALHVWACGYMCMHGWGNYVKVKQQDVTWIKVPPT